MLVIDLQLSFSLRGRVVEREFVAVARVSRDVLVLRLSRLLEVNLRRLGDTVDFL